MSEILGQGCFSLPVPCSIPCPVRIAMAHGHAQWDMAGMEGGVDIGTRPHLATWHASRPAWMASQRAALPAVSLNEAAAQAAGMKQAQQPRIHASRWQGLFKPPALGRQVWRSRWEDCAFSQASPAVELIMPLPPLFPVSLYSPSDSSQASSLLPPITRH